MYDHGVVVWFVLKQAGLTFSEPVDLLGFSQSLEFILNIVKNYPVNSTSADSNSLLLRDIIRRIYCMYCMSGKHKFGKVCQFMRNHFRGKCIGIIIFVNVSFIFHL